MLLRMFGPVGLCAVSRERSAQRLSRAVASRSEARSALRILRLALIALLYAVSPARAACPGDCNGGGSVDVSELIRGVNIALGSSPLSTCPAFDTSGDGTVAVNELIAAVNAALNGCPATPTPSTPSDPTPTATVAIEPIFPADYRSTFVEVRDCRLGIEHNSRMIRVLANPIAAEPYRQLQNPLPVGSIVIKEEFDGADCSNDADLVSWSVMRKEAAGFDPEDGDWHWQWLDAPSKHVRCDDKLCPGFTCVSAGCHRLPECLARDYMCTQEEAPPRGTLKPVLEHLPAAVLSISGTSPTDVYAVGADPNDGRGPFIIHYDGTGWRRLDSGASGALWWISVTPIDGSFYMAGDGGLILQYTPSNGMFTRPTTPDTSQLFGIWGPSATNLWAVGGDAERHGVLWHFEAGQWSVVDLSAVLVGDDPSTLYKVWGTSGTDVYAVGETGVILHYNGSSWSRIDDPTINTLTLFTVHGSGSFLDTVGGFFLNGVILEHQPNGSFTKRTPSGTPQLNGIFVPPNGNAVAVGNGLSVAARSGSGWTLVNDGEAETQGRDFHATWIDADDGIWAVGGDLSISLADGVLSYGGTQVVAGGPIQ